LIRKLEGFDKYIVFAGFGNVKIKNVDKFFVHVKEKTENACVQFFDAKLVAGWQHLYFAVLNAVTAFKNKLNISNSLTIEILLYASAHRQIEKAVKNVGIHPSSREVAVVIMANTSNKASSLLNMISTFLVGSIRDDKLLELTNDKIKGIKDLFEISDIELEAKMEKEDEKKEALIDLVIEHGALLVTQR
jgi:tRNA threonylcarbamoyladenosine modification (KEOPS) complex Cgi121 subunit